MGCGGVGRSVVWHRGMGPGWSITVFPHCTDTVDPLWPYCGPTVALSFSDHFQHFSGHHILYFSQNLVFKPRIGQGDQGKRCISGKNSGFPVKQWFS